MNVLCPFRFGYDWPESVAIYSDACFAGFGAVMDDSFPLRTWNQTHSLSENYLPFGQNMVPSPSVDEELIDNINYLELVAACLPLLIWAPCFEGKRVIISTLVSEKQ